MSTPGRGSRAPLASIPAALDRAASAVEAGRPLAGTGFWKAVDAARRDGGIAERYADRMAAIDRRSFESHVHLRVPVWAGNLALGAGTAAGIAAVSVAARFPGVVGNLVFLGGFGALVLSTTSSAARGRPVQG